MAQRRSLSNSIVMFEIFSFYDMTRHKYGREFEEVFK